MGKEFKFSVIMPLYDVEDYNVEDYFEEAIESVIGQTIGFEQNIQIILVNDGSPDKIEDLCLKYRKRYPQNIEYIRKENGGVSSARNEGMKHIKGKYVNFFDADDRWALDAFKRGYDFLERQTDVDVVACKYCFFGKKEGFDHPLNDKFEQSGIVDIHKDDTHIQMAVNAAFFRKEALEGVLFDTRLRISEDSIFITQVILKKEKYGVLAEAVYHYRKRLSNDSAIDFSTSSKTWYLDTPKYCYKALFELSKKQFGNVIPYIQFIVMYDIQWRLKQTSMPDSLSEDEKQQYIESLKALLREIDDAVIWGQKYITYPYKCYALKLKYGEPVLENAEVRDGTLFYRGSKVFSLRFRERFHVNILKLENHRLILDGETMLAQLGDRCRLFICDNEGGVWPLKLYPQSYSIETTFTGEIVNQIDSYHIELPVKDHRKFTFWARIGEEKIKLNVAFKRYGKLNEKLPHTYYACEDYLIKYEKGALNCIKNTWKPRLMAELRYMRDLLREKKGGLIPYRLAYFLKKRFKKRPLWLICDRNYRAGDNGEALFRYIKEKTNGNEKVCFFLYRNSMDFSRLKKIGKTIPFDTFRYKVNFLLSDKIISSQIDGWTVNGFAEDVTYMKNLYNYEYVFLQHGIIQNDLSALLQKQKKNIRLFVTSAKSEWESIVKGNYGYTEREVKLLGLPRYDLLGKEGVEKKKIIAFLPTWRMSITPAEGWTGIREYSPHFKETEYFQFYNRLIHDPRLLRVMETEGYTGEFYIHPVLAAQYKDFAGNSVIAIGKQSTQYNEIFKRSSLMITDYSSVAFDFAYLKKPIVYSQFDTQEFYHNHTNKQGYFSYECDGFGPVCYDYESTVQAIIRQIENGCKMEETYRQRVENFFAYTDRGNCERVYRAIKEL